MLNKTCICGIVFLDVVQLQMHKIENGCSSNVTDCTPAEFNTARINIDRITTRRKKRSNNQQNPLPAEISSSTESHDHAPEFEAQSSILSMSLCWEPPSDAFDFSLESLTSEEELDSERLSSEEQNPVSNSLNSSDEEAEHREIQLPDHDRDEISLANESTGVIFSDKSQLDEEEYSKTVDHNQNATMTTMQIYTEEIMNCSNCKYNQEICAKYEMLKDERESMVDLLKCYRKSIEKTGETWMAKYQKLQLIYNKTVDENERSRKQVIEIEGKLEEAESNFKDVMNILTADNEQLRTQNVRKNNELIVINQKMKDQVSEHKGSSMQCPTDADSSKGCHCKLVCPVTKDFNNELKRISEELSKLQNVVKVKEQEKEMQSPAGFCTDDSLILNDSHHPTHTSIRENDPSDSSNHSLNAELPTHSSTFLMNKNTTQDVSAETTMARENEKRIEENELPNQYAWEKHSSGSARKVMEKMGYKGGGLGKHENGREEAVAVDQKNKPLTRKTVIFSSSITRGINPHGFNKVYTGTAKFERFHGRTARDIKLYIPIHLMREQYDSAVIAAGGNDLSNDSVPIDTVATDIIEAGLACKNFHVKNVFICSVLPRQLTRYQARRRTLNNILRNLCTMFGFTFIDNEDITLNEHIDRDGVHLTKNGSSAFCKNIAKYLNDNH